MEVQDLLEREVVITETEPLFDAIGTRGTKSKRDAPFMLQLTPQTAVNGLNHGLVKNGRRRDGLRTVITFSKLTWVTVSSGMSATGFEIGRSAARSGFEVRLVKISGWCKENL
jgi:hypothetical protein